MQINAETINAIIGRYEGQTDLIAILLDIQAEYQYLPREALVMAAQKLGVPLTQVYSVITFYQAFRLEPPGRHTIKVCCGSSCHHQGGARLITLFERKYGLSPGQTSADGLLSLEAVECLGACAVAPAMMIDDAYAGQVDVRDVAQLVKPLENPTQE